MRLDITKWPIVIIASPRTGSTAMANHIHSWYPDTTLFMEPNFDNYAMAQYLKYHPVNSRYILKLLGSSIPLYPRTILDHGTYKIKVIRRDYASQIASHYLARTRNIWTYTDTTAQLDPVAIDHDSIKQSIIMVRYDRDIVDRIAADCTLVYEDFVQFNSPTHKTPRPANYSELISAITDII
jgi:hypothetical protein